MSGEGRKEKGSVKRSELGGGGGPSGGVLARAYWWPEEKTSAKTSLLTPPLRRLALPLLAPAPPAGLGNAPSRWCAGSLSATYQLPHQQQRSRRRRRRPPSAAATTATFSSLSSTVLALCRLSGKREAPLSASPSAPLHSQAAAPRPPPQRWVSRGKHRSGATAGAPPCAVCARGWE